MLVETLISDLKLQVDDTDDVSLLSQEQYQLVVSRSLAKVNGILGLSFSISDGEITPGMLYDSQELIMVQSLVFIAETMRAKVAKNFSFKSGDKSVDKQSNHPFGRICTRIILEDLKS